MFVQLFVVISDLHILLIMLLSTHYASIGCFTQLLRHYVLNLSVCLYMRCVSFVAMV